MKHDGISSISMLIVQFEYVIKSEGTADEVPSSEDQRIIVMSTFTGRQGTRRILKR